MKLSSRSVQRETKLELSMTSMIDVVFLLLIFFMVTTSVVMSEKQLRSAIKVEEESASETVNNLEPVIVEVVESNGQFVYRLGANEMTSVTALTDTLRVFDNKFDGAFVKVNDDAPFDMAAGAIQACRAAGFPTVSYIPVEN